VQLRELSRQLTTVGSLLHFADKPKMAASSASFADRICCPVLFYNRFVAVCAGAGAALK
jgi:hypothetical protein